MIDSMKLISLSLYISLLLVVKFYIILITAANDYALSANNICWKSRRINAFKKGMCKRHPELMKEVGEGVKQAIEECRRNMAGSKWNCTTSHKTYRKILKSDTREAAFLNSLTAAGILHSVTYACSIGSLWQCHCDRTKRDVNHDGVWEWGGCSHDIQYGYNKSKQFTDTKKIRSDIKALVRGHNHEAGRLAITRHMRKVCKCHGLSGSCALKTCWRHMDSFRSVGSRLKEKFDGAPKVMGNNDGGAIIPESISIKPPSDEDLVYTNDSPSFCKPNKRFGFQSTVGRACNSTSYAPNSCDIMCCNRGYRTEIHNIREKCNCKFFWCCEVKCESCLRQLEVSICS